MATESSTMRLPRVRSTVRGLMIAVAVVALVLFAGVRAYRQVIPAGAELVPFWLASLEGPSLVSPDGRRVVHVMFNDAGAAHSGFHWTWLIVDDLMMGRSVVAEGYSLPGVRRGESAFPLEWLDDRTFSVEFVAGRHDATPIRCAVRLD